MFLLLSLVVALSSLADAHHCYNMNSCGDCIRRYSASAQDCRWCVASNSCGMYYDDCSSDQLVTNTNSVDECPAPVITELPGDDFFADISTQLTFNPEQRNYGISVTDIDHDGKFEFVVAGFGYRNLAYKWNEELGSYDEIADEVLQDSSRRAIGLAACDIDGDGYEELYVLNTDQYSGDTTTSDGLFDHEAERGFFDLFREQRNLASGNFVAGRSCACVDRYGNGVYSVAVSNYGGPLKLFEINGQNVLFDAAPEAGMSLELGGRALVAGPIVTDRMDLFANNEVDYRQDNASGRVDRDNYLFAHTGSADGTYSEEAKAAGINDPSQTGRGTALFDANGDGLVDIVYGNWNGPHRLFVQERDAEGNASFTNVATDEMAVPSKIRTVIVADFDNDGYEEIFWNNIPGENRLFRKLPEDDDWVRINIGDAVEVDGMGTGAAIGDFDGDGMLELVVAHGESGPLQPLSLFEANWGRINHFLRVIPRTSAGAPARGARVDMVAGGRSQLRIIDAGSGYLCQMEPVAHFGLGDLTEVESVSVLWTDGTSCSFTPGAVDSVVTVRPSVGACEFEVEVVREAPSAGGCTDAPPQEIVNGDTAWDGRTVDDFFNEYYNVFRSRNRNAASHKWASFVLERSAVLEAGMFDTLFASFCPVSGSIVYKSDQKRYGMQLERAAGGGSVFGYTYFCCWPCVCDTRDFIRVDTKTVRVQTESGFTDKQYHFTVIANPCENTAALEAEWASPFSGQMTSVLGSAPEVQCVEHADHNGLVLEGATLSDHGYPIIGMLHEAVPVGADDSFLCTDANSDSPGRLTAAKGDFPGSGKFNYHCDFRGLCQQREDNGFDSGMGAIFRKLAEVGTYHPMCDAASEPATPVDNDDDDEDTPDFWTEVYDRTFDMFSEWCGEDRSRCSMCGGKFKKEKCKLKARKVKCQNMDMDICEAVGCKTKKGKCKGGRAKFIKQRG